MKKIIALVVLLFVFGFKNEEQIKPPNILFIAVDDLRPELGCYGNDFIKSPNIDKLAANATVFKNHYVAVPTCGASRHALLTGFYPRKKIHLSNNVSAALFSKAEEQESPETFIHQLKRNGYYTVGIGKISHHPDGHVYGYTESPLNTPLELPYSWDEMLLNDAKWGSGHNSFFGYADGTNRNSLKKQVKPYEKLEVDDEAYVDGLTANLAIEKIKELKKSAKPFFLGLGFFKPHLPFNAPKKYWDMYDEEKIGLSPNPYVAKNTSIQDLQDMGEFNQYELGEEKAKKGEAISDDYARKLRHAYFACISYVDAQIGKVIDELQAQGLADNTIIVLWGDHGWHLGDHTVWGKHTIFDRSLHSPLIIKVPSSQNGINSNIVSTIDIYPTLMDYCGLKMPYKADGMSLKPLIGKKNSPNWRNTAYSYFREGISLKTNGYRVTKYFRSEIPEIELFDHSKDKNETVNIAKENPKIVNKLLPVLQLGDFGIYN